MAEIISNRFKIELTVFPSAIYFFTKNELQAEKNYLARYKPTRILQNWKFLTDDIKDWLNKFVKDKIEDEAYIYVSFLETNDKSKQGINFQDLPFFLQKVYLKELFIRILVNHYIIEPIKEGIDISIYLPTNIKEDQYKHKRFDVIFNVYQDSPKSICYEAIIGVGSTNTLLLQLTESQKTQLKEINKADVKIVTDNLLVKNEAQENIEIFEYRIKANAEIRAVLGINNTPKKKFYK